MIETIAFQTRARTVDHLGREQIADCPTAISELWKNAYDAYAKSVALNICDTSPAIATITDDGHGMNREEFISKWLVIGTESKIDQKETPERDRNGLPVRVRQGQKGIGRLSSANLGPLLLFISKRKGSPFIAALIDWRIFENPFLFMGDVEIPITEFGEKSEIFQVLPALFDKLMGNIWGSGGVSDPERDQRIQNAWEKYTAQEVSDGKLESTQTQIAKTLVEAVFEERIFLDWPLWSGKSEQGTILAVADIQFDLESQFAKYDPEKDSSVRQARDLLFQTLSTFCDPFVNEKEAEDGYSPTMFSVRAIVREGQLQRTIVSGAPPLDLQTFMELEHILDGVFDEDGVFRGKIKAFGEWLDDDIEIKPAINISKRKDALVGPFRIRMGTFEQMQEATTFPEEVFRAFEERARQYGGLFIFKDGLRVMPYGREGTDFFRIEERRSKHAGRAFWSFRRVFGHVILKSTDSPNLRDKAGREGFIDNKAAKSFRDLVEYVLQTTASRIFGTDSKIRQKAIPELKAEYKKKKIEAERDKQSARNRKLFRTRLERGYPNLIDFEKGLSGLAEQIQNADFQEETEIFSLKHSFQDFQQRYPDLVFSDVPRNLGPLEETYLEYRKILRNSKKMMEDIERTLGDAIERVRPRSPKEIAYSELSSNAAFLHRRIRGWAVEAKQLLASEQARIAELQEDRNKVYHAKTLPLLEKVEDEPSALRAILDLMGSERDHQDLENSEIFEPYISALSSLKESIDLEGIAHSNQDQIDELHDEVDRLHGLAQLGITVELIGHEIEGLEQTISETLTEFPEYIQQSKPFKVVRDCYGALVDRLRFLSPLKISGPKTKSNLTGQNIFEYVQRFFKREFKDKDLLIEATPEFLAFSIYEQPARIFPVFINLINNAIYWTYHGGAGRRQVRLSVAGGRVIVSDSGPGVDQEDRSRLFKLFFTRKVRGGRGVGLYLCRTNLAAGGHTIEYSTSGEYKILPGANFVINFRGGQYV